MTRQIGAENIQKHCQSVAISGEILTLAMQPSMQSLDGRTAAHCLQMQPWVPPWGLQSEPIQQPAPIKNFYREVTQLTHPDVGPSSVCACNLQDMFKLDAKYGLAGITHDSKQEGFENIVSERLRPWLSSLSKQQMDQLSKLSVFGGTFTAKGAAAVDVRPDTVAALNSLHELGLLQRHPCRGQQLDACDSTPDQQDAADPFDRYSMHPLIRVAARAHLLQDRSMHYCTTAYFLDFLLLQMAVAETLSRDSRLRQTQWASALIAHEQKNIKEMYRVAQDPTMSSLASESRAQLLQASANGFQSFGHLPSVYMLMRSAAHMREELWAPGPRVDVLLALAEMCRVGSMKKKLRSGTR